MATYDAAEAAPPSRLRALFEGPPNYTPITAWGPISALAITTVACFAPLAAVVVGIAIASALGADPIEIDSWTSGIASLASPAGIATMALSQLVSLGVIWLASGRGGLRRETLRLAGPPPSWTTASAAGLLLVVLSGGVELILYWLLGFDLFTDTRWLMDGLKGPAGWGVAFIAVGLAPLWEELTFRGFLLSALAKSPLGYWPAALICTGLWTLLHWSYSVAGLTSVFVAGLMLSWMMRRLGSMRVVVVAHALANVVALAVAYVFAPVG
jgi:membrane protease YdiL (CAAX protease family)